MAENDSGYYIAMNEITRQLIAFVGRTCRKIHQRCVSIKIAQKLNEYIVHKWFLCSKCALFLY